METKEPSKTFISLRKVAWLFIFYLLIWFIYVSPKTPLEFYDAGNEYWTAWTSLKMKKYIEIDPDDALIVLKYDDLDMLSRQKNRIALEYDLIHDPANIQKERSSIIHGFYDPSEKTETKLLMSDKTYRELSEKIEELQKKCLYDKHYISTFNRLQNAAGSDDQLNKKLFLLEFDSYHFREFQARIFWWSFS